MSAITVLTALTVLAGIIGSLDAQQQPAALAICTANNGVVGRYANPQDTLCQQ